jgi:hypothetical protein
VYIAETRGVPEVGDCFRDTREGLVAIRKSNGVAQTLLPRIDAAEGLSDCDDIDNSTHLEVSADGSQAFASFDSGGLWRLRPSPLQFLDSSYFEDVFRLHPDGSVVFATVRDGPTQATVSVFKISASQVAAGALPVNGLPPCATYQLPNNRLTGRAGARSRIAGIAVSPPTSGSHDGTILVSVATPTLREGNNALCAEMLRRMDNLTVRGTVAFASPADSTSCQAIGLINLEALDYLTF